VEKVGRASPPDAPPRQPMAEHGHPANRAGKRSRFIRRASIDGVATPVTVTKTKTPTSSWRGPPRRGRHGPPARDCCATVIHASFAWPSLQALVRLHRQGQVAASDQHVAVQGIQPVEVEQPPAQWGETPPAGSPGRSSSVETPIQRLAICTTSSNRGLQQMSDDPQSGSRRDQEPATSASIPERSGTSGFVALISRSRPSARRLVVAVQVEVEHDHLVVDRLPVLGEIAIAWSRSARLRSGCLSCGRRRRGR